MKARAGRGVNAAMNFRYSHEVQRARDAGAPLVALETSVVAQGLPYPENLAAARVR